MDWDWLQVFANLSQSVLWIFWKELLGDHLQLISFFPECEMSARQALLPPPLRAAPAPAGYRNIPPAAPPGPGLSGCTGGGNSSQEYQKYFSSSAKNIWLDVTVVVWGLNRTGALHSLASQSHRTKSPVCCPLNIPPRAHSSASVRFKLGNGCWLMQNINLL